jgi:hypothetical protein
MWDEGEDNESDEDNAGSGGEDKGGESEDRELLLERTSSEGRGIGGT